MGFLLGAFLLGVGLVLLAGGVGFMMLIFAGPDRAVGMAVAEFPARASGFGLAAAVVGLILTLVGAYQVLAAGWPFLLALAGLAGAWALWRLWRRSRPVEVPRR